MSSTKRIRILAAGVAGAIAAFAPAGAADFTAMAPQDSFNWSGFFVGAGVGAGAAVHDLGGPGGGGLALGLGGEGIQGEIAVGYDHLLNSRFLVGVFAHGRYGGGTTSISLLGLPIEADLAEGFDIGARAGMLVTPSTLAYAMAGYTHQRFDLSFLGTGTDWTDSGVVVGAGIETALSERLSAKVEYAYRHYGGFDFSGGAGFEIASSTHSVLFGLNYRFGAGAGPVSAGFTAHAADWTGWFVSGSLGGAGIVHELSDAGLTLDGLGGEGIFGALGAGYDHDFGNGVVGGVEARAGLSAISTDFAIVTIDAQRSFDIAARLGYKLSPSTLLYGLAGYANTRIEIAGGGTRFDWNADALMLGAGLETALTEHLFAGVEYRYLGYETLLDPATGTELQPTAHTGQITLKYKF